MFLLVVFIFGFNNDAFFRKVVILFGLRVWTTMVLGVDMVLH